MKRFLTVSWLAAAFSLACGGPTAPDLHGGVLVTFDVVGQPFRAWVTRPTAIEQALALQRGASRASIPVARILRGSGEGAHNAPYHWHLDPENIEFAELAIEVCDGTPGYVESHIADFVDAVKSYCPWSAKLVALRDYRAAGNR